jgi:hypothetical protein
VAKIGTYKAGGTISQQAAVHPWLAADAHVNKQTTNNPKIKALDPTKLVDRTPKDTSSHPSRTKSSKLSFVMSDIS